MELKDILSDDDREVIEAAEKESREEKEQAEREAARAETKWGSLLNEDSE